MTTYESRRGRVLPPDLDDRTWQNLVDEMKALIPQYAPQWTDQNPSDLGMTLLELFAWLAEGLIYRINRTPEKNYIHFLNLLGITRDPAIPARTYLTFEPGTSPVTLTAGVQAQTASREGQPIVFETDEDVTVLPTTLRHALLCGPFTGASPSGKYRVVTPTLVGPSAAKVQLDIPAGSSIQLFLGFEKAVAAELELGFRLFRALPAPPLPDPPGQVDPIRLTWTSSPPESTAGATVEPKDWPALKAETVTDATGRLSRDGQVAVTLPATWTAQRAAGAKATKPWGTVTPESDSDGVEAPLFWLGLRIDNTSASSISLGLDRLLFNAASACTALTTRAPEDLGTSSGAPFQAFELAHRPLYRAPGLGSPYRHLTIQVGKGVPTVWEDWDLVDELPGGSGTCYTLNPVTGEVRFGNHDPASGKGNGSIPPAGARVRASSYRHVRSGAGGNVDAGQVTVLGTTLAGGDVTGVGGVTNLGPGRDGVDEEPIEDTLRRAPQELKIRNRAVTAEDYEFLAGESGLDLSTVRCLGPRLQTDVAPGAAPLPWVKGDPWAFGGLQRAPGNVTVIVVPDQGPGVERPEPTPDQLRQVRAYLEARRDLTVHLDVVGPRYLPVIVTVDLVIWQQAVDAGVALEDVRRDTLALIKAFLHPTRGGPEGKGWKVGRPVFTSDLFQAITPPDDIGYISALSVRADVPPYFAPLPPGGLTPTEELRRRPFQLSTGGASVRVADYELVCAAAEGHLINPTKAPL